MGKHKTIEQILTESFWLSFKMMRHLFIPLSCLSGLEIIAQWCGKPDLLWFSAMAVIALCCFYYLIIVIFLVGDYYRDVPFAPLDTYVRRADLTLFLENLWLSLRIAVTSVLLVPFLVLPAIVYFVNRKLASYALNTERVTVSEALRESKRLMTAEPWYRLQGPQIRLSVLLTVFFPVACGVMFLGIFLEGIVYFSWKLLSVGELIEIVSNSAYQIVTKMIWMVLRFWTYHYSIAAVGLFYFDLKGRYAVPETQG